MALKSKPLDAVRKDDSGECSPNKDGAWDGNGCLFPDVNFGLAR